MHPCQSIVREHAVDESFVINEIKDYLSGTDACRPEKQWFEGDSILTNKSAQERRFWLGRECNSFESAKNQWDSPCAMAACLIARPSRASLDSLLLLTTKPGRAISK